MLQRYGYPEQSFSQVLIRIESCVACLGIQRNTNFIRHVSLSLWLNLCRLWKVSVTDTEIVDILHKAMKTVLRWDKEFWREGFPIVTLPTPGDHYLNKLESTLRQKAFM
jgi:hypothetical protein